MKSIEQLNAEHAAAMVKLADEHALAAIMPAVPDTVLLRKGRHPSWAIYRKRTLSQAIELAALFHCVPLYQHKGTFTELTPDGCGDPKANIVAGPFACVLDVNQGGGFGPSVQIYFYAGIDDPAVAPQKRLVRVVIDIEGPGYIGGFPALAATRRPIMGGPRGNMVIGHEFSANNALNGYADSYVRWGTGDNTTARFSYLFCADDESALSFTEQTHALGQLRNLRDEFQPAAELIESTARADYYRIPGVKGAADCFAAVKPGAPAPANAAGYYSLESLKSLKGDS